MPACRATAVASGDCRAALWEGPARGDRAHTRALRSYGSLRELLKTWDVPVYAHHTELPFLTGRRVIRRRIPPWAAVASCPGLLSFSEIPIDLGARRRVSAGRRAAGAAGLAYRRYARTHPGACLLFREEDRLLLAGDAFVTLHAESLLANLTLDPRVQRPPAYFTPDWPATRVSLLKLAELAPETVATGHGQPLGGEVMKRRFPAGVEFASHRHGLPAHGRYRGCRQCSTKPPGRRACLLRPFCRTSLRAVLRCRGGPESPPRSITRTAATKPATGRCSRAPAWCG